MTASPSILTARLVALAGILTLALILWSEERSALARFDVYADALRAMSTIDPSSPSPQDEGSLVHATGSASATQPVQDTDLDQLFEGALAISRLVEMYQWQELVDTQGRPFHIMAWSSTPLDHDSFAEPEGHANPPMQIRSERLVATDASLGKFALSPELLSQLVPGKPIAPPTLPRGWTRAGDALYLGLDATRPRLGDLRVSYRIITAPATLSMIGRQADATLTPYTRRDGTEILRLKQGALSPLDMLDDDNPFPRLWAWRIAVTLLFIAAMALLLSGIAPMVSRGSLIRMSAICGSALALCITGLAWLLSQPLESAASLVVAMASLVTALDLMAGRISRSETPDSLPSAVVSAP